MQVLNIDDKICPFFKETSNNVPILGVVWHQESIALLIIEPFDHATLASRQILLVLALGRHRLVVHDMLSRGYHDVVLLLLLLLLLLMMLLDDMLLVLLVLLMHGMLLLLLHGMLLHDVLLLLNGVCMGVELLLVVVVHLWLEGRGAR